MKTKTFALVMFVSIFLSLSSINAQNLVSEWKMDEGRGDLVADSAGNNDCTRYNFTDGWVTGKYGYGLEFDKTQETFLDCGNDSSLNFGAGDFSVEFWMKMPDGDGGLGVMGKMNVDEDYIGWYFYTIWSGSGRGNQTQFYTTNGTDADVYSVTRFADNIWHHTVGVRNSTHISYYVDGVLENVDNEYAGDISCIWDFIIGNFNDPPSSGDYFNGTLDNVRLWNRSLTGEEIQNLYLYDTLESSATPTPLNDTLSDVGQGVGNLLLNMASPVAIFIILLALGSMVGFMIASIGKKIGGKV